MNTRCLIAVVALAGAICPLARAGSLEQEIKSIFAELGALRPMQPGQRYSVLVGGQKETGFKEQFLRRRTADEISASGATCGCGDYALLFMTRIEPHGFATLLVEGAEISSGSLENHFSGHAVVAVRDRQAAADSPWWLIDSTNFKVLSRNWTPEEKSFEAFGRLFWVGYCGSRSDYSVSGPDELKAFYTRTLETVPVAVFNRELPRLKFTVDPSLVSLDGKYLNPRLAQFLNLQDRIFSAYHITPEREVPIRLTRGRDDHSSDVRFSEGMGWGGAVGLKSACSSSLLTYFENALRLREQHPAPASGG